jgi:hypothetical protein
MKTLQIIIVFLTICYACFFAGRLSTIPSTPSEPEPVALTDWNKFYNELNDPTKFVMLDIGISAEDSDYNDYQLYLVDEGRWHCCGNGTLRGCGPVLDIYRFYHMIHYGDLRLRGHIPTKNAKFVAIGASKPKIVEIKVLYENEFKEQFE